jgi:hypothetical protein
MSRDTRRPRDVYAYYGDTDETEKSLILLEQVTAAYWNAACDERSTVCSSAGDTIYAALSEAMRRTLYLVTGDEEISSWIKDRMIDSGLEPREAIEEWFSAVARECRWDVADTFWEVVVA